MSTPTPANIPLVSPPIPSRPRLHDNLSVPHDTSSMTRDPSSPSDSSSQSGMADNETEAERSQQSEVSAPAAPAPKKKRTRTLTTPQQSAVLHALLAKSRFPTTAMREEVGRQIGLSARKVQIWFQNQRQKARRPQSDSAPLSRPPQFGPFPTMAPSPSSHTAPASHPSFSDTLNPPPRSAVPGSGSSLEPGLSGPGIPGRRMSPYPSPAEYPPASPEQPASAAHRSSHRVIQEFPSLTLREPAPRCLAPRPFLMHENTQSPPSSRVLPPIYSSPMESRICIDPHVLSTSSSRLPPSTTRHHSHASDHTKRPTGIPPPFALQPQPQWDPQSFNPYTRPDFVSFLPSATRGGISIPQIHDRATLHVSPDSARRRQYCASSGEPLHLPSSQARPHVLRDVVEPSSRLTPTRDSHLPSALSRPGEYPSCQPSSTGDSDVRPDGNRLH